MNASEDHEAIVGPMDRRAADQMAAIIDEMIERGELSSRSPLADARLDYGEPFTLERRCEILAQRGIGGE